MSETHPIRIEVNVYIVELVVISDVQKAAIKKVWQKTNKNRNGDHPENDGVEEQANLKVKSLLAVIVHKGMFFPVCEP